MVRIKICGITSWEDANLAVELGADALGFIFAESPRNVDPEKAEAIICKLPPFVSRVGVFLDHSESEVKRIAELCDLDTLQFHGRETPDYCSQFAQRVIKSFRIRELADLEPMPSYQVSAFLLDTFHESLPGGTGKAFDWEIAVEAKRYGNIILSGGLNPDNVLAAVRQVKPYAVDVSSGVEASPGKKDPEKLRAFFEAVRKVNASLF